MMPLLSVFKRLVHFLQITCQHANRNTKTLVGPKTLDISTRLALAVYHPETLIFDHHLQDLYITLVLDISF
jgi:hypothetical protein